MTKSTSKKELLKTTAAAALLALGAPLSGGAATANVAVGQGGLKFVPATTNITAGDQVVWTWAGNNHSTTSTATPSLWDSGVHNSPNTYSLTFGNAGTFAYQCSVHGAVMSGSIVVAAAVVNNPPTVSLTSPANAAVFAAPATVTLRASAADSDGTVTNVQFLVGGSVITNVTSAPYAAVAGNLAAGGYTLTAIASDNSGAKATNSVGISVVTPSPVSLGAARFAASNRFQFAYTADTGLSYIVQVSTNLTAGNWVTLSTNTALAGTVTFTHTNAPAGAGFYRVGRLPNP